MQAKKALIVIDMQNDFITGTLANKEAEAILEDVGKQIRKCQDEGTAVFFTRDTHEDDYLQTQEGRMLPVPHCIRGTEGWQIAESLRIYANEENTFDKTSFGSLQLPEQIRKAMGGVPQELVLCGVCTDICVISNGLILKAAFRQAPVRVLKSCCAGVTPQSHEIAIAAMKACQIIIEE